MYMAMLCNDTHIIYIMYAHFACKLAVLCTFWNSTWQTATVTWCCSTAAQGIDAGSKGLLPALKIVCLDEGRRTYHSCPICRASTCTQTLPAFRVQFCIMTEPLSASSLSSHSLLHAPGTRIVCCTHVKIHDQYDALHPDKTCACIPPQLHAAKYHMCSCCRFVVLMFV